MTRRKNASAPARIRLYVSAIGGGHNRPRDNLLSDMVYNRGLGKGRIQNRPRRCDSRPNSRDGNQPRTRSLSACGPGDLHRHVHRREPLFRPPGCGGDRVARDRDARSAGGLRGRHGPLQRGHGEDGRAPAYCQARGRRGPRALPRRGRRQARGAGGADECRGEDDRVGSRRAAHARRRRGARQDRARLRVAGPPGRGADPREAGLMRKILLILLLLAVPAIVFASTSTQAGDIAHGAEKAGAEAAQAEAQRILASARAEVDTRLKYARHELTEFAGELAAERAEQIVKETITEADQKKLFSESVKEVAEAGS